MADNTISDDVLFMADSTDGKDGAKEVIMDYVISWTLRRAQNCCSGEKPILYRYCRNFLGFLLKRKLKDSDIVLVKTWKQENWIDLWVWVSANGVEYDILIEDKYYSRLRNNQLSRYKLYFDDWLDQNRRHSNRRYWLLTCLDRPKTTIYNSAKRDGFTISSWDDMKEALGGGETIVNECESDIFNEFWLKWQ